MKWSTHWARQLSSSRSSLSSTRAKIWRRSRTHGTLSGNPQIQMPHSVFTTRWPQRHCLEACDAVQECVKPRQRQSVATLQTCAARLKRRRREVADLPETATKLQRNSAWSAPLPQVPLAIIAHDLPRPDMLQDERCGSIIGTCSKTQRLPRSKDVICPWTNAYSAPYPVRESIPRFSHFHNIPHQVNVLLLRRTMNQGCLSIMEPGDPRLCDMDSYLIADQVVEHDSDATHGYRPFPHANCHVFPTGASKYQSTLPVSSKKEGTPPWCHRSPMQLIRTTPIPVTAV